MELIPKPDKHLLLDTMENILERIVYKRLLAYDEPNEVLLGLQYEFWRYFTVDIIRRVVKPND